MGSPKTKVSPEELLIEALTEEGGPLSSGEQRRLTSGLSALRGGVFTECFNSNEMKAVRAMVAYVAATQEISEEAVSSILATAFDVGDIQSIPQDRYESVMDFLFDLKIEKMMN